MLSENHMSTRWPAETEFRKIVLKAEDNGCRICGSALIIRSVRIHRIYSLEGPIQLVCKLSCCSNRDCGERKKLISPRSEIPISMPRWRISWDLLLWMGFRRYKRHWSVPQIQNELLDNYQINLSEDTITKYLSKYQGMVAARHQDMSRWRDDYKDCSDVILTIDGLQPEKGHETLYVVRELRKQRVWFAETLLSGTNAEILKLIQRTKGLSQQLGKLVRGWVSDKQDAFVTAIAAEFPNIPHRYCNNHFLRDLAKPVLEKDSRAKVQMRRKVRGLRSIEKEVLEELDQSQKEDEQLNPQQKKYASSIVLDYCAAVRGILNDNHGGPLRPPGLRMADALEEVSKSLERNLKHGETPISSKLNRLNECIKRGLAVYQKDKDEILGYVKKIKKVFNTLDPKFGSVKKRLIQFKKLKVKFSDTDDPIQVHMNSTMKSFEPGLFVGSDDLEIPPDNLDLERWFKKPKGHERRINGRQHAGTRIVQKGPTLLPALDAHIQQMKPFTYQDLLPYVNVEIPKSQAESIERNRIMVKASSKKKRPKLLKKLENHYQIILQWLIKRQQKQYGAVHTVL